MEKIQLQAARVVTGTNSYAPKYLLYRETGWEKLSVRREKHRFVCFFFLCLGTPGAIALILHA